MNLRIIGVFRSCERPREPSLDRRDSFRVRSPINLPKPYLFVQRFRPVHIELDISGTIGIGLASCKISASNITDNDVANLGKVRNSIRRSTFGIRYITHHQNTAPYPVTASFCRTQRRSTRTEHCTVIIHRSKRTVENRIGIRVADTIQYDLSSIGRRQRRNFCLSLFFVENKTAVRLDLRRRVGTSRQSQFISRIAFEEKIRLHRIIFIGCDCSLIQFIISRNCRIVSTLRIRIERLIIPVIGRNHPAQIRIEERIVRGILGIGF